MAFPLEGRALAGQAVERRPRSATRDRAFGVGDERTVGLAGKLYYPLHGQLGSLPKSAVHRPDAGQLWWDNEHMFLG